MLLAYVGPDTMMPMASVVAAVLGGVLMFGRATIQAVARLASKHTRGRS